MDGFTLARVPRITQASGVLSQLGAEAVRLSGGGPVLLVADPGLRPTGAIDRAQAALSGHGLPVRVFAEVKSDPGVGQIDAAAAAAREAEATLVVALGGGSALDVGKA